MNPSRRRAPAPILVLACVLGLCGPMLLPPSLPRAADVAESDLASRAREALGSLPSSMPSAENPVTPAKAALGRSLFWEPRISIDGTVSCAKCHPLALYAADGLAKAVGNSCKENPRNAPTVFNAASQIAAHWIGNRTGVEDQAKQALVGPPAFGMPSYEAAEKVLKGMPGYVALFREAFPDSPDPVSADNFALAVGAFERTLVTPAPFDDFLGGRAGSLEERQKRGLAAFLDAGCAGCHSGPFLGGQMYRKFGLLEPYARYTGSAKVDDGRFAVTKKEEDRFVFKVPVLRNVAATPPYFHDGSVARLEDAVAIMARIQLGKELSPEQGGEIASFLGALTGRIPPEALAVPVLPLAH